MPMIDGAYVPLTRTRVERMEEWLGPDIEGYDFAADFGALYPKPEQSCERAVRLLRECQAGVCKVEATDDGGSPRCGWGTVTAVGMAAKWPYWRPRPTVVVCGWRGSRWLDYASITDVRRVEPQGSEEGATDA